MLRPKKTPDKVRTPLQMTRAGVIRAAQRALIDAIIRNGEASADDIRAVVVIPDGIHPAVIGTAVYLLARDGIIVPVNTVTAQRPIAHAHLMRVWRLADPDQGNVWLASNPTPIAPDSTMVGGQRI